MIGNTLVLLLMAIATGWFTLSMAKRRLAVPALAGTVVSLIVLYAAFQTMTGA